MRTAPSAPPGTLLVLEGGEGVGKSTQAARLAHRLRAAGHRVHALREPGGTPLGERVRALLLDADGAGSPIDPRAEALLFLAARAQLVATVIGPALAAGDVVLLDRMALSTYAYQGAGRGLGTEAVRDVNRFAVGGLVPDLTILLGFPAAAEGLARAAARAAAQGAPPDRMEAAGAAFHARVHEAFASYAEPGWQARYPEAGPIVAVDAGGTPEAVEARVVAAVARHTTLARRARPAPPPAP